MPCHVMPRSNPQVAQDKRQFTRKVLKHMGHDHGRCYGMLDDPRQSSLSITYPTALHCTALHSIFEVALRDTVPLTIPV